MERPGTCPEGNAAEKITSRLTASGAVGRQRIGAGNSYTPWNVGAGYALAKTYEGHFGASANVSA